MSRRVGTRLLEGAVQDLFDSRAEARIYLFLLRHEGALGEEVIRGTRLHPRTVRELLSRMFAHQVIVRRKLKTDSIGKNPYLYFAVSPVVLLRRRAKTLEQRLNLIASYGSRQETAHVRIWVREEAS